MLSGCGQTHTSECRLHNNHNHNNHNNHTNHNQRNNHTAVSTQELPLCVACCETPAVGLMADGARTSAMRRKQRATAALVAPTRAAHRRNGACRGILGLPLTPRVAALVVDRQWHVPGWFSGFGASRAVFPSIVGRPELPGLVVGMDEKDCFTCYAGCAGGDAPRVLFPTVVDRPRMLGIMAVMERKDFYALIIFCGSGTCKAGF